MINKRGISSFTKSNPTPSVSTPFKSVVQVRVVDIILNENHPLFDSYWGLGTIIFDFENKSTFNNPNSFLSDNKNDTTPNKARPLSLTNTIYPVIGENVLVFLMQNPLKNDVQPPILYFYFTTFNINNHPYHNAIPTLENPIDLSKSSKAKGYSLIQNTSPLQNNPRLIEPGIDSPLNPSQNTFLKSSNVNPLLPFSGDVIYQGRFGNSIRFGSTSKPTDSQPLNTWSSTGENGNPITIIRNGQSSLSPNEAWIPTIEDINYDSSSIWMPSSQKIPIEVASENYNSYSTTPESPSQYTKPQVIINSDRLVFNAKTDSILLSAEKSVGLSSNDSLNFNTKNYIVDAGDIKLGSKDATEPLVKGETLYKNLTQIVDALRTLVDVMEVQQLWPGGVATPDGGTAITARTTRDILDNVKKDLVNIKSTVSKTV